MHAILAGPADCGNVFGIFRRGLVPAGKFAVVTSGEYANGGYGPSSADGQLYPSEVAAQAAADRLNAEEKSNAR